MDVREAQDAGARPERLVVLCRANVVRSPLAAGLLRALLDGRGRTDIQVSSAGLAAARGPAALAEEVLEVGRRLGVDLSGHQPVTATAAQLAGAAMVLTMTESQRAATARVARSAIASTFTLAELVRLADDGLERPAADLAELARLAHRARPRVAAPEEPEDVADPVGGSRALYEAVADRIAHLTGRVVEQLAPGAAVSSAGSGPPGVPDPPRA